VHASLYVALTELASDEHSETFTASKALIAHKAGLSVKTVERLLRGFEEMGLVKIDRTARQRLSAQSNPHTYSCLNASR